MQETFLSNSENKNQLNMFLAKEMIKLHKGPQTLVVTYKDSILSLPTSQSASLSSSSIGQCQSEEADQRVVRHAMQCFNDSSDYEEFLIRSGDTDVIILLAANLAPLIHNDTKKKVFFQMVSTSSQKIFDVVAMIRGLGVDVSRGLPWFHAFTGCDIVSSFIGKGKITIWDSWMTSKDKNQLTALFVKLSAAPAEITDTDFCLIQQFVKYFYNKRFYPAHLEP